MSEAGYYCVIQYCPDPGRAEVANIGVMLWLPSRGHSWVRTSRHYRRIAQVFGRKSFDRDLVRAGEIALCNSIATNIIRTVADLRKFVGSRGNDIIMTAPRACRIDDPAATVERMYGELVEYPPRKAVAQ